MYFVPVLGWLQAVQPSLFSVKVVRCFVKKKERHSLLFFFFFSGFSYAGRIYRLMNSGSDVLLAISM